jgi:hypothetical protein
MKQDEIRHNNVDKSEKPFCVTDCNTYIVQARPVVTNIFCRKSENGHVVHDSFLFRLLCGVQVNAATM